MPPNSAEWVDFSLFGAKKAIKLQKHLAFVRVLHYNNKIRKKITGDRRLHSHPTCFLTVKRRSFFVRTLIQNALIYDSAALSFFEGALLIGGSEGEGRIIEVLPEARHAYAHLPQSEMSIDAGGRYLIPGFVDVHTHGRACEDFNFSDREGMLRAARSYAAAGVTSLFPTLASAPFDELCTSAALIRELSGAKSDGARFLGTHLEGRYLNPSKRGAHAAVLLAAPNIEELELFAESAGTPLHMTVALELDGVREFAERAREHGITLGLGHTNATFDQAMDAWRKFGVSFTHLYNAMPQIHHREGGAAAAALMSGGYCELICDGMHVSPHMVAFTLKNIGLEKLVLISDSMAAAGAPDGDYMIAGTPACVRGGVARTPEGALAGSTLDLHRAVENLARFTGIKLSDAILAATRNPAAEVGLEGEVGVISPGAFADLLFADVNEAAGRIDIDRVMIGGRYTD